MKRFLPSLAVVASIAALGGVGAAAGSSPPRVFAIVPSAPAMTPLASAAVPNADGSLILPPAYLSPRNSAGLSFPALQGIWQQAGVTYGIPWQVLAAINKVESNFGQNMGPSSAGAVGWMQFMPSTWQRWGMDANGDGIADPWDPHDAIFAAARYLAAAGGQSNISRAIFSYNHAQWYVDEILGLARTYGQGGIDISFTYDKAQVKVQDARQEIARQNRVLVRATLTEQRLARRTQAVYARADAAPLLSDRLELQKKAFQVDSRRAGAAQEVGDAKKKLAAAEQSLSHARSTSWSSTGASAVAPRPYQGDYVFPVGGGPSVVSVGHHHHDYPAADIAAPEGSPLYALTDGFIVNAWHMPSGNCGIGLTMRAAVDGREWTYCHMSYEEPSIQTGMAVSGGQPVGLVGHTGHATGPHLHIQLTPPVSYPQIEPWFQAFAGTAFRWQDAPTMDVGPVFTVVGGASAPSDNPAVIPFTLNRP
jgi:murein DD-endopeptidase MepM/ murein hydrolase activator NlpD